MINILVIHPRGIAAEETLRDLADLSIPCYSVHNSPERSDDNEDNVWERYTAEETSDNCITVWGAVGFSPEDYKYCKLQLRAIVPFIDIIIWLCTPDHCLWSAVELEMLDELYQNKKPTQDIVLCYTGLETLIRGRDTFSLDGLESEHYLHLRHMLSFLCSKHDQREGYLCAEALIPTIERLFALRQPYYIYDDVERTLAGNFSPRHKGALWNRCQKKMVKARSIGYHISNSDYESLEEEMDCE